MSKTVTNQFNEVKTPSGKKAFEAFCAVYDPGFGEEHIVICSPSMEALERAWNKLVKKIKLNKENAQHVWIVRFLSNV